MFPYALLQHINSYLKEILVRQIQIIKTGFGICPASSIAKEKLYTRMREIKFYSTQGECKIEKPRTCQVYHFSGIVVLSLDLTEPQ